MCRTFFVIPPHDLLLPLVFPRHPHLMLRVELGDSLVEELVDVRRMQFGDFWQWELFYNNPFQRRQNLILLLLEQIKNKLFELFLVLRLPEALVFFELEGLHDVDGVPG